MGLYHNGDVVRVRDDLVGGRQYNHLTALDSHLEAAGQIGVVYNCGDETSFKIDFDAFDGLDLWYGEDMVEPYSETIKGFDEEIIYNLFGEVI